MADIGIDRLGSNLSNIDEMFDNKSEKGGRPNSDVILMFKISNTSTESLA
jgi:hypothetical protein